MANGNITVFMPNQDNCLPNTAAIPTPEPITIQLTSSTKTTHLRSSKSKAVHMPTTIMNIRGNASCKTANTGNTGFGNVGTFPKIECQSLLIHFPISLPSVIMNGNKPCANAITALHKATIALIKPPVTVTPLILLYLTIRAVFFALYSFSFSACSFAFCPSNADLWAFIRCSTSLSIFSFSDRNHFCLSSSTDFCCSIHLDFSFSSASSAAL